MEIKDEKKEIEKEMEMQQIVPHWKHSTTIYHYTTI